MFAAAKRMRSVLVPQNFGWAKDKVIRQLWAAVIQPPPPVITLVAEAPDNGNCIDRIDGGVAMTLITGLTSFCFLVSPKRHSPKTGDVVSECMLLSLVIAGVSLAMCEWYGHWYLNLCRHHHGGNGDSGARQGRAGGSRGAGGVLPKMWKSTTKQTAQGIAQPQ